MYASAPGVDVALDFSGVSSPPLPPPLPRRRPRQAWLIA